MIAVRLTVLGGAAIWATTSVAAPVPYMPRKVYQLIFSFAMKDRIRVANVVNGQLQPAAPATPVATPKFAALLPQADDEPRPQRAPILSWLDENIFGKIQVTGTRTLGVHAYSVTGDKEAFDSVTNYGQGFQTFTDEGSVTMSGKNVAGLLTFQMQAQDQRLQDPTTQQMTLSYDRGPLKLSEGDVRGSLLNSNPLATFSKSLKGTMVEYQRGPMHFKALYSETKGTPVTLSIQGANSAGPYYLESGKIEGDGVAIMVDGQSLKLGQDYTVDAQAGSVTFLNRIIAPTSTIVATYEAVSPNETPGILGGAAVGYDFGKLGSIGVTAMQVTGTGTSGDGTIVDTFQYYDNGVPSVYTLEYEPTVSPVSTLVVSINGRLLAPVPYNGGLLLGIGYAYNPTEPRQILVSPGAGSPNDTLSVKYKPIALESVQGDRRVVGMDYRLPIGKDGSVHYSIAEGTTLNSGGTGGYARQIDGQYSIGPLSLSASVKEIPPTYVSVESEGFNRNEDGVDLSATMKSKRLTYGMQYSNSSVLDSSSALGTTTTATSDFVTARSTFAEAFARYNAADGLTWSLTQTRTAGHLLYDSQLDTTSFTGTKTFGKFKLDTGLDYQNGMGPLTNSSGVVQVGGVNLETFHVGGSYAFNDKLTLQSRASISDVRALGQTSNGEDLSLSSVWKPSARWTVTGSAVHSVAGQAATLQGFSNGTGYGYGGSGNGFSGGVVGDGYLGAGGSNLDQQSLITQLQPTKRLSFTAHIDQTLTTGALTSNSSVHTIGVGTDWDLGNFNILNLSLDQSRSEYVSSTIPLGSIADTANLTIGGAPRGPWSYRVGFSTLINAGSTLYSQNTLNYDLTLGYRLAKRQTLSMSYLNGEYTGYSGQSDREFALSYGYDLFQNIGLVASYRIHQVANLSDATTSGAYRAAGFDLELNFGFRP